MTDIEKLSPTEELRDAHAMEKQAESLPGGHHQTPR